MSEELTLLIKISADVEKTAKMPQRSSSGN